MPARPLAATLAWGENREFNGFNGNSDGYLAEAVAGLTPRSTLYGRAEVAGKELFGLAPHEKQDAHRHWISTIGAFSIGYSHLLPRLPVGIGADVTLYRIPDRSRVLLRAVAVVPRLHSVAPAHISTYRTHSLRNKCNHEDPKTRRKDP